jgi:hypothetical protein
LHKINGSDALPLGDLQQFNDRALHNLRLGFCGLSRIIHLSPFDRHVFCTAKRVYSSFWPDCRRIVDHCLFKTALAPIGGMP